MIKYRLTKKGKIVIVIFCTFTMLCIFLGASYEDNYANKYYDSSKSNEGSQYTKMPAPEPPQKSENKEEPWETLKAAVFFEANRTGIDKKNIEDLNKLIDIAKKYDGIKIQVEGNCATLFPNDSKQESVNYNISLLRAQSVANYLIDKGISNERIIVVGNGSEKPLKDNSTVDGRKYNRRVDIFFVKK